MSKASFAFGAPAQSRAGFLAAAALAVIDESLGTSSRARGGVPIFGLESADRAAQRQEVNTLAGSIATKLRENAERLPALKGRPGYAMETFKHDKPVLTPREVSIQAAAAAAMVAQDWKGFLTRWATEGFTHSKVGSDRSGIVTSVMTQGAARGMDQRVLPNGQKTWGLEAYDERNTTDAARFNVSYQLGASSQNEFGEALFPTIVMDPTRDAYEVVAEIMTVYDRVEHDIENRARDPFAKRNLLRAIADPTILKKDQNRCWPVVRPENLADFVDAADVAVTSISNDGETFDTAPVKFRTTTNLLNLGQTNRMLDDGGLNMTDSLDPYLWIENIYVKVTIGGDSDVLKFRTLYLPYANFTYSQQDNYRLMVLNGVTGSVVINKDTKQADGSALVALAGVVTGDRQIRLKVAMSGRVNIETGETFVDCSILGVQNYQDANGVELNQAVAPNAAIVNALKAATPLGFDPRAFMTNMNRRRQGQFVDMTRYTQAYRVPLRQPITAIHPAYVDGAVDAADVQMLIQYTRTAVNNEAVTALLEFDDVLKEYVDVRDATNVGPDVLGIGRFYVRAYHNEADAEIDVLQIVDSLRSAQRLEDVAAGVLNKIRSDVYEAWRSSEYAAAAEALMGGAAVKPVATIACDPYVAQFLFTQGDLRTLGNEFEIKVVHTLDIRMKNRLFVVFSLYDEHRNTVPHPLNYGNMLWAPELALTANISRGNTYNRETVVQPRYLFVQHCPIMLSYTVKNLAEAVSKKITINTNEV